MTNSIRRSFATRLQQALAEAGYADSSLKELATLFGVSGQAVRKWLNAEAMPGSSRAPEVARKLGVRRAWLLDGETPMRALRFDLEDARSDYRAGEEDGLSISSTEFRLLSNYRALPHDLQDSISATLDAMSQALPDHKS